MKQKEEIKKTETLKQYLEHPYWLIGPGRTKRDNERGARRIAIEIARFGFRKTREQILSEAKEITKKGLNSETFGELPLRIMQDKLGSLLAEYASTKHKDAVAQQQAKTAKEMVKQTSEGLLNLYGKGIILAASANDGGTASVVMGPFLLKDERTKVDEAETPPVQITFMLYDAFTKHGWTDNGAACYAVMKAVPLNCKETHRPWISTTYPHPHICDGRICCGEATPMLARAFAAGDIPEAVQILFNTLSTYNGSSPYRPLINFIKPEMKTCKKCGAGYDSRTLYTINDEKKTTANKEGEYCENCSVPVISTTGNYIRILREEMKYDTTGEYRWIQQFPDRVAIPSDANLMETRVCRKTQTERRGIVTAFCKELGVNITMPVAELYPFISAIDEVEINDANITEIRGQIRDAATAWAKANNKRFAHITSVLTDLRTDAVNLLKPEPKEHKYTPEAEGRLSLLKKTLNDLENLANEVEGAQRESQETTSPQQEQVLLEPVPTHPILPPEEIVPF